MITFNELRITPDNKYLVIDVYVEESSCYNDITIENIVIDNQDTYTQNGPSSNPIAVIDVDNLHKEVIESNGSCNSCDSIVYLNDSECYIKDKKKVRLLLNLSDYGINLNDMLFVYVITNGETSCSKPSLVVGTVVNLYLIYEDMMKYIREIECSCTIPKEFIDKFLRFKAIDLCIRSGNYTLAIKYWNKFFRNI